MRPDRRECRILLEAGSALAKKRRFGLFSVVKMPPSLISQQSFLIKEYF